MDKASASSLRRPSVLQQQLSSCSVSESFIRARLRTTYLLPAEQIPDNFVGSNQHPVIFRDEVVSCNVVSSPAMPSGSRSPLPYPLWHRAQQLILPLYLREALLPMSQG